MKGKTMKGKMLVRSYNERLKEEKKPRVAEARRLADLGHGYNEIARRMGLNRHTIRTYLGPSVRYHQYTPDEIEKFMDMYRRGLSVGQIAVYTGFPRSSVHDVIRRFSSDEVVDDGESSPGSSSPHQGSRARVA